MNERGVGDNQPPGMVETIKEVTSDLSSWMSEHPVISNEDEAREAKLLLDRASLGMKDLEDERKGKVAPLNEQVKQINDHYRSPRELLEKLVNEFKNRISAFVRKEEQARLAVAEAARLQAENAERIAREAEARESDAYKEASDGVLDVDLGAISAEASAKFRQFEKAARQAALAERETKVRIGGGFTRALGLRNKEELVVVDGEKAIREIGWTEDLIAAILKGARAFRKLYNRLPQGIEAEIEREI